MKAAALVEKTKKSSSHARFSDTQIQQVAEGGKRAIEDWVRAAARRQRITLHRRPTDSFARAVSRLSDGVVDLDSIEETLVVMSRVGIITPHQRGLLQVRYLR